MSGMMCFLFMAVIGISAESNEISALKADPYYIDFGTIREGVNVPVHFRIFNEGSGDVFIREIRTFAACVQTRPLKKQKLNPGESLDLNYVFESFGFGGVDVDKTIEVYFRGKASQPLILRIKGKVLALEAYQSTVDELDYGHFVLIDIRSRDSFVKEHILGALHVERGEIEAWLEAIPNQERGSLIVYLYCDDGFASDDLAKRLMEKGFSQCTSLVGGIQEWKARYGNRRLIRGKY